MDITEISSKGLKREYSCKIPSEAMTKTIEEQVESYRSQANLPGFRKGKVPANVIKQRYLGEIKQQALQDMIKESYTKFLQDREKEGVKPAVEPTIDNVDFKDDNSLHYHISIECLPEVQIPDFVKVNVEELVVEISEKEIDHELEHLAEHNKEFVKDENAKAEKGDEVVANLEGRVDGNVFDAGKVDNFSIHLGSASLIPGFEDQLEGVKAGDDTTVNVTFPDNYPPSGDVVLAGKDAEFSVHVLEVRKGKIPEIDDAFAKKFEKENLAELRDSVKEHMEGETKNVSRLHMKKQLFDKLEKLCKFDLPETMVKNHFDALWKEFEMRKQQNPNYVDKPEEELKKDYENMAERRVRLGIMIMELASKEKIEPGQDEIRQAIYERARQFQGQEHKVIEYYRNNPQAIEELKGPIIEEKAVDWMLEKVTKKEKKVTKKQLSDILEKETII